MHHAWKIWEVRNAYEILENVMGRGSLEVMGIGVRRIFKIDLDSVGYLWDGRTELMTRTSD
jgi:hypothetical protein